MVGYRRAQPAGFQHVPHSNNAIGVEPVQVGGITEDVRCEISRIHLAYAGMRDNRVPQEPAEHVLQYANRVELTTERV